MVNTASKIRQVREYKNISQMYMAEQLNISQPAYAQVESGKTSLSENRLKKIAEILEVDITTLISDEKLTLNIQYNTLNNNSSIVKELNTKQSELYERLLVEKDKQIKFLQAEILKLKDKTN